MNKFNKITKLLFLLLFLNSCGSVGEALQGKKRSDQGDEFLVDKKNPLVMPPDYDKLPIPGEKNIKNNNDVDIGKSNLKYLLKNSKTDEDTSASGKSTSIENSILEKIN